MGQYIRVLLKTKTLRKYQPKCSVTWPFQARECFSCYSVKCLLIYPWVNTIDLFPPQFKFMMHFNLIKFDTCLSAQNYGKEVRLISGFRQNVIMMITM